MSGPVKARRTAFEPDSSTETNGAPSEQQRSEPPTIWAADLAQPLPPIRAVCRGLTIVAGRPTVLVGEGGTRKGWFAMAMQLCAAAGTPLLGRFSFRDRLRSLYLDYEQTERVTRERFQLLAKGQAIDLASLEKRLGYRWKPVPTWAPKSDSDRQKAIDTLCWQSEDIDLAIVDSVRTCSPGVEENSVFASAPLDIATEVSQRTGATFLFLDHAGKPPKDEAQSGRTRKHAQRGHSSKLDAGQTLLVFSASKGQPTLVTCERSQLFAEPDWPKDFRFTIGPASGGLQLQEVLYGASSQPTPEEELAKLCVKFLAVLRPNPGASLDEITKRMGVRLESARAARDTLERKGLIENRGTKGLPKWWPTMEGVAGD